MSIRFPRYGALFALLALAAVIACDSDRRAGVGPSPLSSGIPTASLFSFEPAALRAEPLFDSSCVANHGFGTRIIVIIAGAGGDVSLRGLRFRFTDRFGVNTLPRVAPISGSAPLTVSVTAIRPPDPIPLPGLAPLPSITPIVVPAGSSQRLPFFLQFDCGVAPEGMLVILTDVVHRGGPMHTSEFRVRVGS